MAAEETELEQGQGVAAGTDSGASSGPDEGGSLAAAASSAAPSTPSEPSPSAPSPAVDWQSQAERYRGDYERTQRELGAYQAWVAQVRQAAEAARQQAQPQPEKKSWWQAPKYDPSWERIVSTNPETGKLEGPGEVVAGLQASQEHARKFLQQLGYDAPGALKGFQEETLERARAESAALVREAVAQALQGYQAQNYAQAFIQQHNDWLFAKDAQGQPTQQLSEHGQRFATWVNEFARRGVRDEQAQAELAWRMVYAESLGSQGQQAQRQLAATDHKKQYQRDQATRRGGANTAPEGRATEPGSGSANLYNQLMQVADTYGMPDKLPAA